MKVISALLTWCVLATPLAWAQSHEHADNVSVGDSMEVVQAVLGEPRSYMGRGTYEILQYDRGRVELRDGKVTAVQLLSAKEAERLRLLREKQRREREAVQAEQREQLRAEGVALRDRVLNDPDFGQMTAANQLAFWSKFRRKYPDVPIELEQAKAWALVEREQELERERERGREMEGRVAEAERRTAEAEQETKEALRRRDRYVDYAPPFSDYTPLVVGHPYVVPLPIPMQPAGRHGKSTAAHSGRTTAQGGVRHNYTVEAKNSDLTFSHIEELRSYPKSPPPGSSLRIPHP